MSATCMYGWPDAAAVVGLAAAIEALDATPSTTKADALRMGHRVWDTARAVPVPPDGRALDAVLADSPRATVPPMALEALLIALLAEGSHMATIEKERDALNRIILERGRLRRG